MAHHAAPRIPGFDYRGTHAYLVTVCTFARRPTLVFPDVADVVASQFLQSAELHAIEILIYGLMPDHLHIVCRGLTEASDLCLFLGDAKEEVTRWFKRHHRRGLWQQGFHDRVLRTESEVEDAVSYVLHNPVRAGLVASPAWWPFLGSSRYRREEVLAGRLNGRRRP